jgi:hypothetical protein
LGRNGLREAFERVRERCDDDRKVTGLEIVVEKVAMVVAG